MKKFVKITAAALAAATAVTLAGCGGCAGCSGNNRNYAPTNSNWYTGTSYKGIQPSFIAGEDKFQAEVIEYDVSFIPADGNKSYSVSYTDGSYKTEFYAEKYSWADNAQYPSDKEEILYCYKTEMTISVQFTLTATGEKTEVFRDGTSTVAYFRAAGKNLQPVYSYQRIVSHSAAERSASKISEVYRTVNVVYENFYNYDCTEVKSFTSDGKDINYFASETSESYVRNESSATAYRLDTLNYSIFDNNSLYIAMRSMKLSDSLSQRICLFNAAAGGVNEYAVTGSSAALGEAEHTAISAELERCGLFTPDPAKENDRAPTVAVHVNFAGGNLTGTTQTAWFAAITDADKNAGRATMLKLQVPLSYGLGTLNYTLKEIKSTLWNG